MMNILHLSYQYYRHKVLQPHMLHMNPALKKNKNQNLCRLFRQL